MKKNRPLHQRALGVLLAVTLLLVPVLMTGCSGTAPASGTTAASGQSAAAGTSAAGSEGAADETKATESGAAGSAAESQAAAAESGAAGTDGAEPASAAEPVPAKEEISAPALTVEAFPKTDGSTATLPLYWMLYRLCTGATQEEAESSITFTKTNNAYTRLMDGDVSLVIAYEPGPTAKEDPRYKDLTLKPIGLDALVFLCNTGNPVESLTTEELQNIYSGKLKNWKEVGGSDVEIVAFQREVNSGSQTLMENLLMKDIPMAPAPAVFRPSEMGELIDGVAKYSNTENALGYSVYFYAKNMYTRPNLRFMAVDGVLPSNETIQSGEYKYVNPFYAAVRKDEPADSEASLLFDWLTSGDGQSLVEATGYVGVEPGTKVLPEKYRKEMELAAPDASLRENNHGLAVSGSSYDGDAGVVFFDSRLNLIGRNSQITLEGDEDFGLIRGKVVPANPLIYAEYGESGTVEEAPDENPVGLFSPEEDRWIVEPTYSYCYTESQDGEHAIYYMGNWIDQYDEDGNAKPYTIDLYNEDGELIRTVEIRDWDEESRLLENTIRHGDSYETIEPPAMGLKEDERILVLKNGVRIRENWGEEEHCSIEKDGVVLAEGGSLQLLPAMSDSFSEDRLPWHWVIAGFYDSGYNPETDEYYYQEGEKVLLDGTGTELLRLTAGEEAYIALADRFFVVLGNYDSGKYTVYDYEGNELMSWIVPDTWEYGD